MGVAGVRVPWLRTSWARWTAAAALGLLPTAFFLLIDDSDVRVGTIYVAVVGLAALVSGFWPAVLATATAVLGQWYAVLPPRRTFELSPSSILSLLMLVVSCGVVLAILGLLERSSRDSQRLRALTDQAPVGLALLDRDLRYVQANARLGEISGRAEDVIGRPATELSPAPDERLLQAARAVLATGDSSPVIRQRVLRDGDPREFLVSYFPVAVEGDHGPSAPSLGVSVLDVTERSRLERDLRESRSRLETLLTFDVLPVIVGDRERILEANDAFLLLVGRSRAELERGELSFAAMTPARWRAVDDEALRQLRTVGRSEPYEKEFLRADGQPVRVQTGVAVLSTSPVRWISYVVDLSSRHAVEQRLARALADRDRVARTLQTSLLPGALPTIPGLQVAARYLPSTAGAGIGGDFYDVVPDGDGWAVVLGDVCGRGVDAAALTSLVRYSLRTAIVRGDDPVTVLATANQMVIQAANDDRFATVAHLALHRRPTADGSMLEVTVTLGGHHQPRLVRRGVISRLGHHGMLIGVYPDADFHSQTSVLEPGDVVVTFTDGLVEQTDGPDEDALDRTLSELSASAGSAEELAQALEALAAPAGRRLDDVAFIVLRVPD